MLQDMQLPERTRETREDRMPLLVPRAARVGQVESAVEMYGVVFEPEVRQRARADLERDPCVARRAVRSAVVRPRAFEELLVVHEACAMADPVPVRDDAGNAVSPSA